MKRREFTFSVVWSVVLLLLSLLINFHAGLYAKETASNSVTDVILSNTRVYDVDFMFVWGSVAFWVIVITMCLLRPQRIPFVAKSVALFILIRSLFISLTHIGPFPDQIAIDYTTIIGNFTSGGDLFFSGHTGLPFLMALVFWELPFWRYFFLVSSGVFAIVVLAAHVHYSIDVLAAFFITYSIFHIAQYLFFEEERCFKFGIVKE